MTSPHPATPTPEPIPEALVSAWWEAFTWASAVCSTEAAANLPGYQGPPVQRWENGTHAFSYAFGRMDQLAVEMGEPLLRVTATEFRRACEARRLDEFHERAMDDARLRLIQRGEYVPALTAAGEGERP